VRHQIEESCEKNIVLRKGQDERGRKQTVIDLYKQDYPLKTSSNYDSFNEASEKSIIAHEEWPNNNKESMIRMKNTHEKTTVKAVLRIVEVKKLTVEFRKAATMRSCRVDNLDASQGTHLEVFYFLVDNLVDTNVIITSEEKLKCCFYFILIFVVGIV